MGKKMDKDTNALNWFEIPATDLARATKFYETIFDIKMGQMEMPNIKMSMFPPDGSVPAVGGALAQSDMHKPGANGPLIYLNANPDLQLVVDRIDKAGGKVIMPKTQITPEYGYMAFFSDTEGNTVGLHSNG
jgi:uncharacterized protein